MIEYNSRLNNFFGARVVPLLTQITAQIKQEKKFSINFPESFMNFSLFVKTVAVIVSTTMAMICTKINS